MQVPPLLGVLLAAVAIPLAPRLLDRLGVFPSGTTPARLRAQAVVLWALAALAVGYVTVLEGRPLSSVGLRVAPLATVVAVVLGFALAGGLGVTAAAVCTWRDWIRVDDLTVLLAAQPIRWKLALAIGAGVGEELLYRGILIERAIEVFGDPVLAGALSVVAFGAAHVTAARGRAQTAAAVLVGVGLTVAYLFFRDLLAVIAVHAAWNALVMLSTTLEDVRDELDDPARLSDPVRSLVTEE